MVSNSCRCFVILTTLILSLSQLVLQAQNDVDVPAEYPGGLGSFYEYITQRLVYPQSARLRAREGKVFVQFHIDSKGIIVESTVRAISSFDDDCSREAERIIRECKTKWTPAKKGSISVSQRLILPIVFTLGDERVLKEFFSDSLSNPVKAVLVAKPGNPKIKDWQLYSDINLRQRSGWLSPGDTIEVISWGPWLYGVKKGYRMGYISWRALPVTKELAHIAKQIETHSPAIESRLVKQDSIRTANRKQMTASAEKVKADAFLKLSTSKKSIVINECTTLELAFYVGNQNRVPLQFHELGQQLANVIGTNFNFNNAWIASNNIFDIEGVQAEWQSKDYTKYKLYEAAVCPLQVGPFSIAPIALDFASYPHGYDSVVPASFATSKLLVQVLPIPASSQQNQSQPYPLVGSFSIADSLSSVEAKRNFPVSYSVTIRGEGITFSIKPPRIKGDGFLGKLIDFSYSDTIVNGVYQSSKTFRYSLTFTKTGQFDFSRFFSFNAYNTSKSKTDVLTSSKKITIVQAEDINPIRDQNGFMQKNMWIAIDASESMMIEDCEPNRLQVVKEGLKKFLEKRKDCDIGIILFGGEAFQYQLNTEGSCYSARSIDSIDFLMVPTGTAIGNAIWLGSQSITQQDVPKRMVIIGDGDNTAGIVSPNMAIDIAKRNGLKVYPIGVGTTGLVPFGRDANGNANMVENTFSDRDFKKIAFMTGGKFYWATTAVDIAAALDEIFGY